MKKYYLVVILLFSINISYAEILNFNNELIIDRLDFRNAKLYSSARGINRNRCYITYNSNGKILHELVNITCNEVYKILRTWNE